jgi:hypothetical protein
VNADMARSPLAAMMSGGEIELDPDYQRGWSL